MVTCTCSECGREFDESEIVVLSYVEYSGATPQKDHVSPCCNKMYEYKD